VEQGPRVVLTRAGPCREDTAAGPHRRRESRIVGVDKRGNSNAAKTRDDKRRVGEPAGDGIATAGNATDDDARVGQRPTG